jgi:cytochrome c peroxidase
MNKHIITIILFIFIPINFAYAGNNVVNKLLQEYITQGANTADAEQGKQLWQKTFTKNGKRSCASCHTKNLTQDGKHIKTGKVIKPMAPSFNPERLTDRKKVNKWFKRNCKWTLGRECTAQEKTNLLVYINESTVIKE